MIVCQIPTLDFAFQTIGVWAMKCIGYDEAFQRDILEKFQHWVPKEKPAKGGKVQKRKRS